MDHGDAAGGFARFRSTKAWASFAPLSIWIVVLCAVLRSVLLWDPHESRRYGCVGGGLVGGVRENGRLSVQKKSGRLSLQETPTFIIARNTCIYQCKKKRRLPVQGNSRVEQLKKRFYKRRKASINVTTIGCLSVKQKTDPYP